MQSSSIPKLSLTKHHETYVMIKAETLEIVLKSLIQLIVEERNELFSYTRSRDCDFGSDEVSIIMSKNAFSKYITKDSIDSGEILYVGEYSAVFFDTTGMLTETGVLLALTKMFAEYAISIICISTYGYNYILFPSTHNEQFNSMIAANLTAIDYINMRHPLQ